MLVVKTCYFCNKKLNDVKYVIEYKDSLVGSCCRRKLGKWYGWYPIPSAEGNNLIYKELLQNG